MIAGQEQNSLRYAHIAAYDHLVEIVNPTILAQPTVVTHHQIPRRLDDNIVLDNQPFADLCPKST